MIYRIIMFFSSYCLIIVFCEWDSNPSMHQPDILWIKVVIRSKWV